VPALDDLEVDWGLSLFVLTSTCLGGWLVEGAEDPLEAGACLACDTALESDDGCTAAFSCEGLGVDACSGDGLRLVLPGTPGLCEVTVDGVWACRRLGAELDVLALFTEEVAPVVCASEGFEEASRTAVDAPSCGDGLESRGEDTVPV